MAGVHRPFGDVFGILFAIEGIFFFLEAIFIAIYIFGWDRLSGWAHFWTGVPIAICGIGGAYSVVSVNAWMNQPQGYTLDAAGNVTDIDPLKVMFTPATGYEVVHMILAAYMVTAFLVASVYAVGMLRGRRDRHHRLGLLIPLAVGCILAPVQFMVGDTAARAIADDQPIKFAAMECVDHTHSDVTEYIYGVCTDDGVKWGIGIPGFDSFLVGFSTDTEVTGLDTVPADERPPANTMLHWAFDTMVGIGTALIALGAWFGFVWWRRARHPEDAMVPARRRGLGDRGDRRHGMRLDRHRGRAPAVDRSGRDEDLRGGDRGQRCLADLLDRARALHRPGHRDRSDPPPDGAALARGGAGCGRRAVRPRSAEIPEEAR